jgi:hypothetical protein
MTIEAIRKEQSLVSPLLEAMDELHGIWCTFSAWRPLTSVTPRARLLARSRLIWRSGSSARWNISTRRATGSGVRARSTPPDRRSQVVAQGPVPRGRPFHHGLPPLVVGQVAVAAQSAGEDAEVGAVVFADRCRFGRDRNGELPIYALALLRRPQQLLDQRLQPALRAEGRQVHLLAAQVFRDRCGPVPRGRP